MRIWLTIKQIHINLCHISNQTKWHESINTKSQAYPCENTKSRLPCQSTVFKTADSCLKFIWSHLYSSFFAPGSWNGFEVILARLILYWYTISIIWYYIECIHLSELVTVIEFSLQDEKKNSNSNHSEYKIKWNYRIGSVRERLLCIWMLYLCVIHYWNISLQTHQGEQHWIYYNHHIRFIWALLKWVPFEWYRHTVIKHMLLFYFVHARNGARNRAQKSIVVFHIASHFVSVSKPLSWLEFSRSMLLQTAEVSATNSTLFVPTMPV